MDFLSGVENDLKDNFGINLATALAVSPDRLNVATSENWQIYFDLSPDSDITSQLTKLNLLLNGDLSGTARNSLQYIDLRFENRAYYR